jgi:hypothetical protein
LRESLFKGKRNDSRKRGIENPAENQRAGGMAF